MDKREQNDRALFNNVATHYALKEWSPEMAVVRKYQLLRAVKPILAKLGTDKIITEIACGTASGAKHLEGNYGKYYGIDYSEQLIKLAKKFHAERTGVELHVLNAKELHKDSLPKADLVLILGALHHFTDIDTVMRSIKNVAKSGAYLVALEPQSGNPFVQFLRWVRGKVDNSYSSEQIFFSENELRGIMTRNGLHEIEIEYQGFFSPPFGQASFLPKKLGYLASAFSVWLDKMADDHLPLPFRSLSWNIVVRARFPHENA